MNAKQLEAIIRKVAREEVLRETKTLKATVKTMIKEGVLMHSPKVVREIVDDEIDAAFEAYAKMKKNTSNLRESAMETMNFNTGNMNSLVARSMTRTPVGNLNIPEVLPSETGYGMPVNPNTVPEHLLRAFNKDYRETIASINEFSGTGMPAQIGAIGDERGDAQFNNFLD